MSTISSWSGLKSTSLLPSMSDCLVSIRLGHPPHSPAWAAYSGHMQFFTMDSEHLKFLLATGHTNFFRGDTQKELL